MEQHLKLERTTRVLQVPVEGEIRAKELYRLYTTHALRQLPPNTACVESVCAACLEAAAVELVELVEVLRRFAWAFRGDMTMPVVSSLRHCVSDATCVAVATSLSFVPCRQDPEVGRDTDFWFFSWL